MPNCNKKDLESALTRILGAIRDIQKPIPVTASIGALTVYPNNQNSSLDVLKVADKALYEAKNRGRDQFVITTEPEIDEKIRILSAAK